MAGGSLEDRVRSGGIPRGQSREWLEQAAVALDAAHADGVVHRDVKPANLLLDERRQRERRRLRDRERRRDGLADADGTVIGTAEYLSPEQAQGDRATPASDRYALGVLARELLTGRRPFGGDTPAAEAAAHVHAVVPPIASQRAGLPEEARRGVRPRARQAARGPIPVRRGVRRRASRRRALGVAADGGASGDTATVTVETATSPADATPARRSLAGAARARASWSPRCSPRRATARAK